MRGRQRRAVVGFVGVVAVAAVGWWLSRPRVSDEERIMAVVARAEHGVETKNRDEVMSCVAKDYEDTGGLSRADIFRLALSWEKSSEQAEVWIDDYTIDVTPPTATGQFQVRVEFSQGGQTEPEVRLPLTVEFEKERRGLKKVWAVKSVSGHGMERSFEGLY
jgi:hypothetical protein